MKAVAAAIAAMAPKDAAFPCTLEGVEVAEEDVIVTRKPKEGLVVASEGAVVVGLETALTPELVAEGLAREFVSHVQNMRKAADFEVTQRIALTVSCDSETQSAIEAHRDYVTAETLATSLEFADVPADADAADINGHAARIAVAKAGA